MTIVQPDPILPDEADRIIWEMRRFLEFVNAAATELDVDIPANQYVDLGEEEVHTCPAVVLMNNGLTTGLPNQPTPVNIGQFDMHTDPAWTLNLTCDIIRCAAKPGQKGIVPTALLEAQVEQSSQDTAVLIGAVKKRVLDYFGQLTASINYLSPLGDNYATRLVVAMAVH